MWGRIKIIKNQNNHAAKYTTVMPDIEALQNEVRKVIENFDKKD